APSPADNQVASPALYLTSRKLLFGTTFVAVPSIKCPFPSTVSICPGQSPGLIINLSWLLIGALGSCTVPFPHVVGCQATTVVFAGCVPAAVIAPVDPPANAAPWSGVIGIAGALFVLGLPIIDPGLIFPKFCDLAGIASKIKPKINTKRCIRLPPIDYPSI